MKDKIFIDSNLWLYSFISGDPVKHERAKTLLQKEEKQIVISVQVVNEVCVNLIKKGGFSESEIEELINTFYDRYTFSDLDRPVLTKASKLRKQFSLSYWDSVIVSAALAGNCKILYSEDMQHKQIFDESLTIINPFEKR